MDLRNDDAQAYNRPRTKFPRLQFKMNHTRGPKFRLRSRIARISTRKVKYARVDLRSFFDFIEAKMSDLEKRVSGLEAEQAQLGNKVNLLRGRVEAVENTYLDNRLQINLRKRVARQGA